MPLLPPASGSEPILILTDQDYRRAFGPQRRAAPPEPGRVPEAEIAPARVPEPIPVPRTDGARSRARRAAAAALLVGLLGGGYGWWRTADGPVSIAEAPKDPPPAPTPEPPAAPAPPPRVRQAPPPPPAEPDPEETPARPAPPPAAPSRGTWNGGRAWVKVHLRMEQGGQVQNLRRRAMLVWDGSQFVVKPSGTSRAELWMDRLQLLINLPWTDEGLDRERTGTARETLTEEAGTFECERVEGVDRFPQQRRGFIYWVTPEFPAGAVRAKVTFPDLTIELRVLGYGPEPGGE